VTDSPSAMAVCTFLHHQTQETMIKFITWYQYFIFTGSAGLLYYAAILLLYYRREIESVFNRQTHEPNGPDEDQGGHDLNFMGKPEFDGQQTNNAEDLFFAVPDEEVTQEINKEAFLLGPVADFLKELKSGFILLKEAQRDKEEFFTLLHILSEKYSQVMQSAYRPLLEVFILECSAEQLPFELTLADLQHSL
jgi:hypothetical protein